MTSQSTTLGTIPCLVLAGLLLPVGIFAQEEPPAGEQASASPPLEISLVAGRDRYIVPGGIAKRIRVGIRLSFGAGAPAFHADMLSEKALAWIDASQVVHPLVPEAGELPAGTTTLPAGTVMRTILQLDPPGFEGAAKGFKLRWQYPGAPSQEISFLAPQEIAKDAYPDFDQIDVDAINRSLLRLHVATANAQGERKRIGSILFRLDIEPKDLGLVRGFLKESFVEAYYEGVPIFHLQENRFLLAGHPIGRPDSTISGMRALPMTGDPAGTRYARGDLVLVATLPPNPAPTNRNMWYGQLMVPFSVLSVNAGNQSPASRRIATAAGGLDLLELLGSEKTVRDAKLSLDRPLEMLVTDGVDYLTYEG